VQPRDGVALAWGATAASQSALQREKSAQALEVAENIANGIFA
jgi:hypothetical protein